MRGGKFHINRQDLFVLLILPRNLFFLHDMMTHSQYNRCNIFVIIKRTEEQLMVALFENFNYSLRICYSKD